jgi:TIR domain-containing protein
MEYDIFISHAYEDKKDFVDSLAKSLQSAGLKIWYDDFVLTLGDSLREKIDYGLANSRYGVVILSKNFFAKNWPKAELDGLVAKQNSEGKKVILPVWHEVGHEDVEKYSPMLAGRLATSSKEGVESVVHEILLVVNKDSLLNPASETDDGIEEISEGILDSVSIDEVSESIMEPAQPIANEDNLEKPKSVFQSSNNINLKEKCFDLIRQDEIIEWRSLVENLSEKIFNDLLDWKAKGETAIQFLEADQKNIKPWREAVYDAIKISIPGAVPILTSIQAGKEDYWRESTSFLRSLSLLESSMGGGTTGVLRIGYQILYVIGALGFGVISKTRQLEMVDRWSSLVLPLGRNEKNVVWSKCTRINYWYPQITGENKNPYLFLDELDYSKDIVTIIGKPEIAKKYLYSGNLLQSMREFSCDVKSGDFEKQIASEHWRPYIMPIWCLMSPDEFSKEIWRLFDSEQEVAKFLLERIPPSAIWPMWKTWKNKCAKFMSDLTRFDVIEARFLYLPGEPRD